MSWRDNKKPRGGYSRGRGFRQNRGGGYRNYHSSDRNRDYGDGEQKQSDYHSEGGHRDRPYKRLQGNHSHNGKRIKYEVGRRLKEVDIGVTQFIGTHKRFSGIVKERFGDFHVHEISCEGEICKLTNQNIPPEPQVLEDMDKLKESIPSDAKEKLEGLTKLENDSSPIEIDVTDMDKETRRNIHIIAKKTPSIVSETMEKDGRKIIVLTKRNKHDRKSQNDNREDWSSRGGDYCHFLLHKVNMDTMDALNQLALRLRIKSDIFQYAGTKDRRARTTQWVSLRKVSPGNIHEAATQVRGAQVGNFKFAKEPLRLGLLKGNRFRIALRSVDANDEEIEQAMHSLRENGFINYYGLQRFGTIAHIPTHEIGKTLLQGKWEEAIDLILKPRAEEQQRDMRQAREIYQNTKSAAAALKPIARSGKIEAKLLKGIVNSGVGNPQGALDYIPKNTRLMYIHSYQSLIWNKIVSRRFQEFGAKPIVGDLVYANVDAKEGIESETLDYALQNDEGKEDDSIKSTEIKSDIEEAESAEATKEEKIDVDEPTIKDENAHISDPPVEQASKTVVSGDKSKKQPAAENEMLDDSKNQSSLPAVKILTEDDLPNYTIADIIMPKPGWKVTYPAYAKPWFDELLGKDSLTTDLRQKNPKYSLGGGYRKVLEKPGDLTWKVVRYDGYHDDLILCDVDEMRGIELPKQDPDGKYKGLILEFSLSSSTYATMALREFLEHDTSAQSQAAQSAANLEQERKEEEAKKNETEDQPAEGDTALAEEGTKNIKMEEADEKMDIADDNATVPKVEDKEQKMDA